MVHGGGGEGCYTTFNPLTCFGTVLLLIVPPHIPFCLLSLLTHHHLHVDDYNNTGEKLTLSGQEIKTMWKQWRFFVLISQRGQRMEKAINIKLLSKWLLGIGCLKHKIKILKIVPVRGGKKIMRLFFRTFHLSKIMSIIKAQGGQRIPATMIKMSNVHPSINFHLLHPWPTSLVSSRTAMYP